MSAELFVQGIDLGRLARSDGPFVSAFLMVDDEMVVVPDAIDHELAAGPDDLERWFAEAVADCPGRDDVEGVSLIVSAEGDRWRFWFTEPLRQWVCRIGRFPSLGPVLEQHQLVASHAMITVERGAFGVTTFGSRAVPDARERSLGVTGSFATVLEELRFAPPRLLALAGTAEEIAPAGEQLHATFPGMRLVHYPVDDLERALENLADRLVRDAATLAAEDVAHELGVYRAAAAEGLVVEAGEVMEALLDDALTAVLVHDDVDDQRDYAGDRLVDAVVATAVARGLPVTMIPRVDERRGPAGGLGGIVGRPGVGAAARRDEADERVGAQPVRGRSPGVVSPPARAEAARPPR